MALIFFVQSDLRKQSRTLKFQMLNSCLFFSIENYIFHYSVESFQYYSTVSTSAGCVPNLKLFALLFF